jgi:NitT/TauT family transport system permease protein
MKTMSALNPVAMDLDAAVRDNYDRMERRARIASILSPVGAVVVVVVLWEAASRLFGIPTYLIPAPSLVAQAFVGNFALILTDTWVTGGEILLGYALSIVVGVPLALSIFLWPFMARTVYPLLVASQSMPKVAIAPLLVVWFGFGMLPKVLVSFLVAFFPIVINTLVGLAGVEQEKLLLARSMGMGGGATFWKIRLPSALPSIFGGLKISMTIAIVGAVVGEFVGGNEGLGHLLIVANGNLDTPLLFAVLLVLTFLGVVAFLLVQLAERLCIRHRRIASAGAGESM